MAFANHKFLPVVVVVVVLLAGQVSVSAFVPSNNMRTETRMASTFLSASRETSASPPADTGISRRGACRSVIGSTAGALIGVVGVSQGVSPSSAASSPDDNGYVPAVRPTAYRVDSTQPPTLIPLDNARKEKKVLTELGLGSGTDKEEIVDDSINLNNMLNKAVFGSIDAVSTLIGDKKDESKIGPGYASFVCLGVPAVTTPKDVDLAMSLLTPIVQARKKGTSTALGIAVCPISAQPALDVFSKTSDETALRESMKDSGVEDAKIDLYLPLLRYAQQQSLDLLAMSPELEDIAAARKSGLKSVDLARRQAYVADPKGFIAQAQDPRYKLYTDRSLLKDFDPTLSNEDNPRGFFAERILVHEAGATVAAKYAVKRPESLVAIVAPMPDLRFLLGINGRIPRICAAINPQQNKINNNAVTTILLNPTAAETLSQSRYLRLEIGTGPETLDYQTKVADYLWFSSSPKVNMIPRLMNA